MRPPVRDPQSHHYGKRDAVFVCSAEVGALPVDMLQNRVAKRSRKLIDYDSARHYVESLQASAIRNERKVAKVRGTL